MRSASRRLISVLASRQKTDGLSDTKFAVRIGTTQSNWWRIKRGKRGIGAALARRMLVCYPDLWREVQDALLGNDEDAA